MIDRIRLAQNLTRCREGCGMSRYRAAQSLGIGQSAYTRWEVADCLPGLDSLAALAVLWDVGFDALLEGCVLVDAPPTGGERAVAA